MNRKQISNGQIGWSQTMADRRTSLRIYGSNRHAKHRPKQNARRAGSTVLVSRVPLQHDGHTCSQKGLSGCFFFGG